MAGEADSTELPIRGASDLYLPGWDLAINHYDDAHDGLHGPCKTCGFQVPSFKIMDQANSYGHEPVTVLESRVIEIINKITDKPRWHEKVFDPTIVERWSKEARLMFEERDRDAGREAALPPLDPWVGTNKASKPDKGLAASTQNQEGNEGDESQKDGNADSAGNNEDDNEYGSEDLDGDSVTSGDLFSQLEAETTDALDRQNEHLKNASPPLTDDVLKFCFDELRYRAENFKKHGLVFTIGLSGPDIVKSDTAVPDSFRAEFAAGAKELESRIKVDWHPGQEGVVRDLIHPSLYPLHYGQTHFVSEKISLEGSEGHIGSRENLIEVGEVEQADTFRAMTNRRRHLWLSPHASDRDVALANYSQLFQWLPAEVDMRKREAIFSSYINNLEYPRYQSMYHLLGKLVDYSIPLWNHCLAVNWPSDRRQEITNEEDCWEEDDDEDENIPEPPDRFFWNDLYVRGEHDEDLMREEWEERWKQFSRKPAWPEMGDFAEWTANLKDPKQLDLREQYKSLQVIVKLASIELTPENPEYAGGSWHVEGLANEHICATSIFYYESTNIADSAIAFRSGGEMDTMGYDYPQDSFGGLERLYGTSLRNEDGEALCDWGTVTTPEGRLLAFPNVFQHRVQPFRLADPAQAGHRKIAVLWLVNPQKPIISTAHVPPQQRERREALVRQAMSTRLPPELSEQIVKEAVGHLPTEKQAKEARVKLMEERRAPQEEFGRIVASYGFCEH